MFEYGIQRLTVPLAIELAQSRLKATISDKAKTRIKAARGAVEQMAAADEAVYGVNTGFGPLCDTRISAEETALLQRNLLLSHAVGVGKPISDVLVRLMLITKVHALSLGHSGIRLEVIERILSFLEADLLPEVPEKGSVGASGDLAPLSHLFLPLIGEGVCRLKGQRMSALEAHHRLGWIPLELEAKEGLALINGTQFMLAHAILGLHQFHYLLNLADLCGAMSLEALQGSATPFSATLHAMRPYEGSQRSAKRIRFFLAGSENLASHANCSRVQDPYSIRCMPQVHGASRQAYDHALEIVETEMNSVTDNPVITEAGEAISGGHFHGQPLALVLDYATFAAAELGNISDRRSYLLLEGKFGLPRLLTESGGLNSGMMIPQYATAALVSENKSLCFPASADSIPTSLGQEDHVSMGSISGRKFNQVLGNLNAILAIELMLAAQGMDFRRPLRFSEPLEVVHASVRERVSHLEQDRLLKLDIDALSKSIKHQTLAVYPEV
jgi:histidine ammonia-lyase